MNNQMREEFETWARERGYNLKRDEGAENYAYRHTDQCWNAWVASRKALVIQSIEPATAMHGSYDYQRGWDDCRYCYSCIVSTAGVKVKP